MAAKRWITVLFSSGGFQFDGREPVGRSNPGMAETVRAQPDIPVWKKSMSPARASGGKALPRTAARRVSYCVTAMEATALFFAFVIAAFFSGDRPLDRPGVYRQVEFLPDQLCQVACAYRLARNELLLDEHQRLALQLVGAVWTALARHQSGEAALVEAGPGLVVGRPRHSVFLGSFGHGGILDRYAAQHLIPDLDEIARVEEFVFLELWVARLSRV